MVLYFITGNKNKFEEVKKIIPEIEQLDLDLPEIQEFDAHHIIEEKLKQAKKAHDGEFICEDTSLYLDCLNGLPGPLIRWFLDKLGTEGVYELVNKYENKSVTARTIIGYSDGNEIKFFEGEVKGKIVKPRIKKAFAWDPIFQAEGFDKSFAEMSKEEKNKISMRGIAVRKLKEFLSEKSV